jgi:tetratricopeptide (TPR) repeat protein
MRNMLSVSIFSLVLIMAAGIPTVPAGADLMENAETLWTQREDPGKASEGIAAYEELLKENPEDYKILLRLSRLHYWVGQILEGTDKEEALAHYGKGIEFGEKASGIDPEKPGGFFFEAANLARRNNLKGTFTNIFGINRVKKLNKRTASIDPGYFYNGTDRFFCAYYTKLPGLLGGSTKKAIEFGMRAVAAYPNYAGNRLFLAEAYVKDGNNDLARKELEAAVSLPDDAFPDAIPEQRMEKKRAGEVLNRIAK